MSNSASPNQDTNQQPQNSGLPASKPKYPLANPISAFFDFLTQTQKNSRDASGHIDDVLKLCGEDQFSKELEALIADQDIDPKTKRQLIKEVREERSWCLDQAAGIHSGLLNENRLAVADSTMIILRPLLLTLIVISAQHPELGRKAFGFLGRRGS